MIKLELPHAYLCLFQVSFTSRRYTILWQQMAAVQQEDREFIFNFGILQARKGRKTGLIHNLTVI